MLQFMAHEFESVRGDIGSLRTDVNALERRVAFQGDMVAALVRQNEAREVDAGQVRGTLAGQQRVLDDLTKRVQRLEEKTS